MSASGAPPSGTASAAPAEVTASTDAIPIAAAVGRTQVGLGLKRFGRVFTDCPFSGSRLAAFLRAAR
jgi:hypothetical protein